MADIKKISKQYVKQQLSIAVALFLVALLVMNVWYMAEILTPAVVSVLFTLVIGVAVSRVWYRIAVNAPESLPTFYTAVSGLRLLAALATLFVYYLVCGRDAMRPFFLVFMAFYFVSLAHHSVFFARVSNRS